MFPLSLEFFLNFWNWPQSMKCFHYKKRLQLTIKLEIIQQVKEIALKNETKENNDAIYFPRFNVH